jgi:multiple sugar transport system ATP-binding protein
MGTVSLKGVEKSFGAVKVVHGVDLEIKDGEFMVFVGPSGCGKSTMLRMIAGLETIDVGELRIGGKRMNEMPPAQRGAAMVFQNYALYPHMTVADNMGFALKLAGLSKAARSRQVGRAAEILRISHLLDRKPKALSGGERQRVAIGRAIVRKPEVFLFDEPLSNLDAALRVQMRLELVSLHQELGTTMIYVTHDQVEAMTMGDRIAVFNQGRMEQVGVPIELYERPCNRFVAGFLGSPEMNLMHCEVIEKGDECVSVKLAGVLDVVLPVRNGAHCAGACQLGVRPERLRIVPADEGLPAKVALLEQLGDLTIAHVKLSSEIVNGSDSLLAVKLGADQGHQIRQGEAVGINPEPEHCLLFAEDGLVVNV